jgi:tRNA(fMet)-specific endonuclease VapC
MILLDTDHISLLQWGGTGCKQLVGRLETEGFTAPPTTIITYEEQIRGWMARLSKARAVAEEVLLYRKLAAQLSFFSTLQVLDFSETAAVEYQRLKKLKLKLGTMDLKIAAIALSCGATVWTRNLVHFRQVPGLSVLDATV